MGNQKSVLSEALDITSHDRLNQYGPPEDNFKQIADYWNVYMSHKGSPIITGKDVAMMMSLMKIAREDHRHKRDNLVDLCGYIRCASNIEGDEE